MKVCISDFDLLDGTSPDDSDVHALFRFLEKDITHIYFNGDTFDFQPGHINVIAERNSNLLEELTNSGIKVTFIRGIHDKGYGGRIDEIVSRSLRGQIYTYEWIEYLLCGEEMDLRR